MTDQLSTYTQLIADVEDWLESHDPSVIDKIPQAISLVEFRLNRRYTPAAAYNRRSNTLLHALEEHHLNLPLETIEVKRVHITDTPKVPLKQYSASKLMERYPYTERGRPVAFALIGETIELSHIPDQDYELRISSRQRIWPLRRDITDTPNDELQSHIVRDSSGAYVEENYWTKHAGDLLLWGAVMNAELFDKNPARAAEFKALYEDAAVGFRDYVVAKKMTENIGVHTPTGVMVV